MSNFRNVYERKSHIYIYKHNPRTFPSHKRKQGANWRISPLLQEFLLLPAASMDSYDSWTHGDMDKGRNVGVSRSKTLLDVWNTYIYIYTHSYVWCIFELCIMYDMMKCILFKKCLIYVLYVSLIYVWYMCNIYENYDVSLIYEWYISDMYDVSLIYVWCMIWWHAWWIFDKVCMVYLWYIIYVQLYHHNVTSRMIEHDSRCG